MKLINSLEMDLLTALNRDVVTLARAGIELRRLKANLLELEKFGSNRVLTWMEIAAKENDEIAFMSRYITVMAADDDDYEVSDFDISDLADFPELCFFLKLLRKDPTKFQLGQSSVIFEFSYFVDQLGPKLVEIFQILKREKFEYEGLLDRCVEEK